MAKQNKFTKSARGEECTLMIYPYCNGNPETTVLCHIKSDRKGWGIKSRDYEGVFACSTCHDIIDKRRYVDIDESEIQKCIIRGLFKTWGRWIEMGVISLG